MKSYMVRLVVDVIIKAKSEEQAQSLAYNTDISQLEQTNIDVEEVELIG